MYQKAKKNQLKFYLGELYLKICYQISSFAEFQAVLKALEFAKHHNLKHLWIETDSMNVVLASKNTALVPWRPRNNWEGSRVIFTHTCREENYCADALARHGHHISDFTWLGDLPSFIRY